MIRAIYFAACCAMTAGCTTTKEATPVELVATPERPAMPTEALAPGEAPFVLRRASLAEIDRREAYEGQLTAALASCKSPVKQPPIK